MKLVILESPYAAKTPSDIYANIVYGRECVRDSLLRGEAPIASHLLYTQIGILDDGKPDDRALGIAAGLAWRKVAQASVVYIDRGLSSGMQQGIQAASEAGLPVFLRKLGQFEDDYVILPGAVDAVRAARLAVGAHA